MDFGLFFTYSPLYPFQQQNESIYPETLSQAVLGDRIGIKILWTPEHHALYTIQSPSALMAAVHIGQHVKCRVGTAVCVLPYRHPLEWAGDAAAADRLLDGRLEFGVARGAYQYEFDRFGKDMTESREVFEETLRTITTLWTADKAVEIREKHASMPSTAVWPTPQQRPHPPIWVGAQTEPTIRWAVREGHHVFNSPFFKPLAHVRGLIDVFNEECQAAGVAAGALRYGSQRWSFVSHSEKAIQHALHVVQTRQRIVSRLHTYEQSVDQRGMISSAPVEGEPSLATARENLLFGTPSEVLDKIIAYDEIGVDHLILSFQWGLPNEEIHESMQLFAEEVMKPYQRHVSQRRGPKTRDNATLHAQTQPRLANLPFGY